MKASKILTNMVAISEFSELSYEHDIVVKVGDRLLPLTEKVSIEFIGDKPTYILEVDGTQEL